MKRIQLRSYSRNQRNRHSPRQTRGRRRFKTPLIAHAGQNPRHITIKAHAMTVGKAADLDARAGELRQREKEMDSAHTEFVSEVEAVRAERAELEAGLAAVDHVAKEIGAGTIRVNEGGKIEIGDPAPVYAAPKPLRDRLMPTAFRLVRKLDETEKRAAWLETMMRRVRALLGRPDLPKDAEKEARDLTADWVR